MILIYGGLSSGKSCLAEELAKKLSGNGKTYYVATMEKKTEAAKKRIEKHRKDRSGKGFITIEQERNLSEISQTIKGNTVLLECVSNLTANILFDRFGEKIPESSLNESAKYIFNEVMALNTASQLIVVTNNIFTSTYPESPWLEVYLRVLGRVNILLAESAESFIECVSGNWHILKEGNLDINKILSDGDVSLYKDPHAST